MVPWVYIAIELLFIIFIRDTVTKVIFANLAAIVLAFCAFEVYLSISETSDGTVRNRHATTGYRHPHDILGYAPGKNNIIRDTKSYKGDVIFDATYTIDADGCRNV